MSDQWIPLEEILRQNPELIEILSRGDALLFCRNNQTGSDRKARFAALYRNNRRFWEAKNWDFFLSRDDRDLFVSQWENHKNRLKGNIDRIVLAEKAGHTEKHLPPAFGKVYEDVVSMSIEDREKRIAQSILTLDEALEKPHLKAHDLANIMTDAAIYSTLINKVSIEEMADEEDLLSQRYLLQITAKTEELMGTFTKALASDYNLNHTAESITSQTKGVTARHMTRVFLLSIRFLDDLRHQFKYAELYRRLQSRMKSYLPLYEPLCERYSFKLFEPSMILPREPELAGSRQKEAMLGILLHDLGKNRNLLYFDGGENYNRSIIVEHAFEGYQMLLQKTAYRQSIASVAGLHHEYYGHEQGYGIFRDHYRDFQKREPMHQFDFILSGDYDDITQYRAVAFLPAKMLEIVDVYDAMVDQDRLYKAPLSPMEALGFMRKNMIDEDLKLDPILFDLFVKFLKKAKLI